MKRRGNRRYYQHHEVLLIRRIRDLLYAQGFTISGARNRLAGSAGIPQEGVVGFDSDSDDESPPQSLDGNGETATLSAALGSDAQLGLTTGEIRGELLAIRSLLAP